MKRGFSALTLKEAMQSIPAVQLTPWTIDAPLREPSPSLQDWLTRIRVFDHRTSTSAKRLFIYVSLTEIVPHRPGLNIWTSVLLESETMSGIADFLIAPDYAYLTTPLLCIAEAKGGDFVQGRAQRIA